MRFKQLPPVDENVVVPAAVRRAAEAAEAAHAAAFGPPPTPEGDTPTPTPTPTPDDPPADPALASAQTPTPTPEGDTPDDPPADPTPHPAAVEGDVSPMADDPPPPPVDHEDPDQPWEHRYKSLRGRYGQLKDRTTKQIADLTERISSLQDLISTLQASPPVAPTPSAPPQYLTEEQRNEFGDEFISVAAAAAQETLDPRFAELEQTIQRQQQVIDRLAAASGTNARERLYQTLDTRLANWREVNTSEGFKNWLSLPDPYSGVIRQELLTRAFEQNLTPQVLAFFNGFLAEEAAVDPAGGPTPTPSAPARAPAEPSVRLEDLAAPGRAKSAPAAPAAEKPIITRADITKFYAEVRAGKYRGRDDDKNRYEQAIFAAEREGRIR